MDMKEVKKWRLTSFEEYLLSISAITARFSNFSFKDRARINFVSFGIYIKKVFSYD